MSPPTEIRVAQDSFEWATEAASLTQKLRWEAVTERGLFLIALSGGRTPEQLYRRLASAPFCDQGEWTSTQFFLNGTSADQGTPKRSVPEARANASDARRSMAKALVTSAK